MNNETLMSLVIAVPILGSILLVPLGMLAPRLRNFAALFMVLVAFVCSVALVPAVYGGAVVHIRVVMPLGLDFSLTADRLAVFMAMVSSLISAIIVIYSFDYISHYPNNNEYYFMVVLFLGSMMGLVYSSNLILLYVFWEITAITSWRLIGFFREDYQVYRANKSFLITVFGALAMLLGFVILWTQAAPIPSSWRTSSRPSMALRFPIWPRVSSCWAFSRSPRRCRSTHGCRTQAWRRRRSRRCCMPRCW